MNKEILPEFLRPYGDLIFGSVQAILILIVGWIVAKWAHAFVLKVFRKRKIDESLGRFLAAIVQYTVLAMGVIAALGKVGIETTSVVAIFATAGLAVGLALQGSLSNFASGVLLLVLRPLTIGDMVTVDGHFGKVIEIGLFATTIVTLDNETCVIPNAGVTGGTIVNHTCRGTWRGSVDIGVAYGTDVKDAMAAFEKAQSRAEFVLQDPKPHTFLIAFGGSSVDFKVFGWAKPEHYLDMLHNLKIAIYEELAAANVEIPFPQMVLHKAPEA